MRIVIDGKVYDPREQPILVLLDTGDLMTILELTPRPPESPAPFFQCPDNLDESEALTLEKAWIEVVRKDAEDEYLGGKLPFTVRTKDFMKCAAVMEKLASTEGIEVVDMKRTDEDVSFVVHCAPEKKIILEDLVCDFGVELIEGGAADRPIMHADGVIVSPPKHLLPSGTVVEFRELDPKVWLDEKLDKVVESFRKSDAMAAFLDEILLRGMTCEHCGHKGLVRPEDGCIRHETVVGKDECPVHGKTIPEVYQDMLMEELSYHPFMQQMGEMRLLCACGEHRDSPIHHKPVTAPDGPSTVMGSSMQEARGLKIVALLLRQDMKEGEFYVDWRWYHERQGKVIVVRAHDGNNHEATINDVNAVGGGWQEVTLTVPEEMPLDRDCKWLGIQWASVKPEEGDGDAGEGQAPRPTA